MPEIEPTLQEAELEMSDEEEDGEGDATGARKRHHEGQESSADEQESGDEDETSSDDVSVECGVRSTRRVLPSVD